jgi:Mg2+ and Co2+ transporter CorA
MNTNTFVKEILEKFEYRGRPIKANTWLKERLERLERLEHNIEDSFSATMIDSLVDRFRERIPEMKQRQQEIQEVQEKHQTFWNLLEQEVSCKLLQQQVEIYERCIERHQRWKWKTSRTLARMLDDPEPVIHEDTFWTWLQEHLNDRYGWDKKTVNFLSYEQIELAL